MNRGDVWLAELGGKRRPVVVLTRDEVLDVRSLVTVAELTTQARGLVVEVRVNHVAIGLHEPCVVNCDGLQTVPRRALTTRVGALSETELDDVCRACAEALGCVGIA